MPRSFQSTNASSTPNWGMAHILWCPPVTWIRIALGFFHGEFFHSGLVGITCIVACLFSIHIYLLSICLWYAQAEEVVYSRRHRLAFNLVDFGSNICTPVVRFWFCLDSLFSALTAGERNLHHLIFQKPVDCPTAHSYSEM